MNMQYEALSDSYFLREVTLLVASEIISVSTFYTKMYGPSIRLLFSGTALKSFTVLVNGKERMKLKPWILILPLSRELRWKKYLINI